MNHKWIKSTLGHGEQMCVYCRMTNREAAVLNKLNHCDYSPEKPPPTYIKELPDWAQWKGEGPAPAKWTAINPETNESTVVYRSYEDYCWD